MIKKRLPKKITPDPIVEAVIGIRFVPAVDPEVVFHFAKQEGLLKDCFGDVEELPIYQLPPSIRNTEPDFKYAPYYRLKGKGEFSDYLVQIGPRVLSIVTAGAYTGSEDFLAKACRLFSSLQSLKIIDKIERLGIRYINFFEENIFNNINLNLSLPRYDLFHENTSVQMELPKEGRFGLTLRLATAAKVYLKKTNEEKLGSVLDVDAYTTDLDDNWVRNLGDLLKEGHLVEKSFFYELITDDFLQSFKVEYEDD